MAEKPYYTTLKNRGAVTVSGPDARTYLQGLISNDVNLLDTQPVFYACLLNAQGKFLHDFFVTEKDGVITLECEGGARTHDLFRKLNFYKLRAKVDIQGTPDVTVYVNNQKRGTPDPRHPELPWRSFDKPSGDEKPFEDWDRQRILLTIPDGSRDLIVEKSALDEGNIDKLNGVSYDKGCYTGQELTARMHHRGLGKKHLKTVKIAELPEGAELRSHVGDIGIALVRD